MDLGTRLLVAIKIISVPLGFFGALSFARSLSPTFDWHMHTIYSRWFNFGVEQSLLLFIISMVALGFSTWKTKPKYTLPLRKVDYSLLLLYCALGLFVSYTTIITQFFTPWEVMMISERITSERITSVWLPNPMNTYAFFVPIIAYSLFVIAFMELIARLRDKTLLSTLHWIGLFIAYQGQWWVWVAAIMLLGSQLYLLTINLIFPVVALTAMTFFVEFLLNLSKRFDEANIEKIRAERFKTELITNVSHDIRTPLTSIINYVDLLKNEELKGVAAGHLAVLDKKSARLKVLIDDLMEASKAGTGNLRVDMQPLNLGEIVGQVAGDFDAEFATRKLTLVLHQPNEAINIPADSRHLHRILENLFSNVTKYALSGTRVFVELSETGMVMHNTSATPINLAHGEITEQFIRGERSRTSEGSGLGLYIAKSLMELMGGTLNITIIGDTFRVLLTFP